MKIRELPEWPTRMPSATGPYVETAITATGGGYVVRWTRAGERFGEVRHVGWRSWTGRCDEGCPIVTSSTRIAAAHRLMRHVEGHR